MHHFVPHFAHLPRAVIAGLLLVAPFGVAAQSDAYPNKPIRLIVPFPPGGGTDLVSRIIQPPLNAALGQPILIDNRGGAQGTLGTGIAAKANPDGYTLVIAEIGATAVAPATQPRLKRFVGGNRRLVPVIRHHQHGKARAPQLPVQPIGQLIDLALEPRRDIVDRGEQAAGHRGDLASG